MFSVSELSQTVRTRRSDMALSKISGLSLATVEQMEHGSIQELSLTNAARLLDVLGLTLTVTPARSKRGPTDPQETPPLPLAARTASVSFSEPAVAERASGLLLADGARFNEGISRLAPTTFIPKGVYRYGSDEGANQHEQDCLVRGMGLLAAERGAKRT